MRSRLTQLYYKCAGNHANDEFTCSEVLPWHKGSCAMTVVGTLPPSCMQCFMFELHILNHLLDTLDVTPLKV